ncbi:MAG: hypothetical protein IJ418_12050 [Clostridia bacterium]|nr:hypothetical protein [Clostridia bacterium]
MPKVKGLYNRDADENTKIGRSLLALQALLGYKTQSEMAEAIGMDRRTWSNRLRDPSNLTLKEIRRMRNVAEKRGVAMPDFMIGGSAQ